MNADKVIETTLAGKGMVVGGGIWSFSYVWAWLGEHNESITSVGVIIGASITVISYVQSYFREKKNNK